MTCTTDLQEAHMSRLTHAQPPILGFRLGRRHWLLAATVIACAAVSLFLVISHDDKAAVMPKPAVADTPAGMRYDGGPDEGTRGLVKSGPAPGVRYDGGPEEGGHGIRHREPSRSLRPAHATTAAPRRAPVACRPAALHRPPPQAFASMVAPRKVRARWGSSPPPRSRRGNFPRSSRSARRGATRVAPSPLPEREPTRTAAAPT